MKTIEELFKQVNTDGIELPRHKEGLRRMLLFSHYFNGGKQQGWDWKLSISSFAFSALLLFISFSLNSGGYNAVVQQSEESSFYSNLANNENVSQVSAGSGENALQMVEDGTKTVFYFNERNVLVHSEVISSR